MKAIKLILPPILVGCSSLHVILQSKININLDSSLLLSFVIKSYDPLLNQTPFKSDQMKTSRMEFRFALCLGWPKPEIFLVCLLLLNCPTDSAIVDMLNECFAVDYMAVSNDTFPLLLVSVKLRQDSENKNQSA